MSDIDASTRALAVALSSGDLSSDSEMMEQLKGVEQYIAQNQSVIMKGLSSLPGPMLVTVRTLVKVFMLIPLKYLLNLPLEKIVGGLEKFTQKDTSSVSPSNSSDCAPTQIV